MSRRYKEPTKLERLDTAIMEIVGVKAGLYRRHLSNKDMRPIQNEMTRMIDGLCKARALLMGDDMD